MISYKFPNDITEEDKAFVDTYVSNLKEKSLPAILSINHLAMLTGQTSNFLYSVINAQDGFYRSFQVIGHSGKVRDISAPLPNLMMTQSWILRNILEKLAVSEASKAYRKGINLKHNARIHRGQPSLLKMDVSNFFDSLSENRVFWMFDSLGFSRPVVIALTKLCVLDGCLPQGAPTSGALANILLFEFDEAILSHCLANKLRYSRYSDDLSISGEIYNVGELIAYTSNYLSYNGLSLNASKTRFLKQNQRMSVTGLTVNRIINPPRALVRKIRQEHFYLKKYGIYNHASNKGWKNIAYEMEKLIGQAAYLVFVRPKNKNFKMYHRELVEIRNSDVQFYARSKSRYRKPTDY